jgi:hypothetical protein
MVTLSVRKTLSQEVLWQRIFVLMVDHITGTLNPTGHLIKNTLTEPVAMDFFTEMFGSTITALCRRDTTFIT